MKPRKRKCKIQEPGCEIEYLPFNSLQKCCPNPKCAIRQAQIDAERKERKKAMGAKEKIKSLTELCAASQRDVNKYVMEKARLEGRVCISCGSPEISDAGHFIHAGSKYRTSRLRFNHKVLEPQCMGCNRFKGGGNSYEYAKGIIARYGQQRLDFLDELKRRADSNILKPLTKDEVRKIGAVHRKALRELKKNNQK